MSLPFIDGTAYVLKAEKIIRISIIINIAAKTTF